MQNYGRGSMNSWHSRRGIHPVLLALCELLLFGGVNILPALPPQDNPNNNRKSAKMTKEELRRQQGIRTEIGDPDWWIKEEVPYIITDQELAAFKKLTTDDDREKFIESFWERRNPHPGSLENSYKVEYYQRLVYANERFGTGIPGWKTDRGRIYIMYGPPDVLNSFPNGDETAYLYPRPYEQWRYGYIDGVGENVLLNSIDTDLDGEYHLTADPDLKDALLRFNPDAPTAPRWNENLWGKTPEFTRLDLYTKAFELPREKSGALRAAAADKNAANDLPFDARMDFFRSTEETDLAAITLQIANRDLHFQNNNGIMHGVADVYGEIVSLGGRMVNTFGESLVLDAPQHEFERYQDRNTLCQEAVPLGPGRYKLSLVLKDELSGHLATREMALMVPRFDDLPLTPSSLILSDYIIPSPISGVPAGPFWIGGTKVRPSVTNTFTRDRRLGIYLQIYNLSLDDRTRKPSLDVRYQIEKDGKVLIDKPEDPANLQRASQQFTATTSIPLQGLAPGEYTVKVKVTDHLKKQSISPSAVFEVR
jgi:GWxTD domain-containing protein